MLLIQYTQQPLTDNEKRHDKYVPSMKTYQCNYISMNCETYVIKGANVREVKAPLKSVTLKELFYDLFVPGVMLSVQTGMILRGPLQER